MISLGKIWEVLESEGTERPDGWISRRVYKESPCDIFVAVSNPGCERALFLEVASDSVPPVIEYPDVQGFSVFPENVVPGPKGTMRICVVAAGDRYADVFEVLAEDVVAVVAESPDCESGIRALLSRVHVWQTFLRRHGEGLTDEEQKGLYAELYFLEKYLFPSIPGYEAVESWKGALGGLRDFQIDCCYVEVKASTVSGGGYVKVPNLAQLDEQTADPLILFHVTLSKHADGRTLPELVNDVREWMKKQDVSATDMLNERLLHVGYHDIHSHRYVSPMKVSAEEFYIVENEFPRIRNTDVREGVRSATYSFDIRSCTEYAVSAAIAMGKLIGGRKQNGA